MDDRRNGRLKWITTKFKEILDSRVKTLHPKIFASLLFKRNNIKHIKTFDNLGFPKIDFVIVNLYPFEKTIKQQYKRRNLLFNNESVLPEFELITMKPFFPLMDTNYKYNSWFESLDDMCKKISKINFDIAIIAAGPYGFHIAAHIKRTGKKAVHLGGVTQLLFGIKGKRWDNTDVEKKLYNKHWIRPLASDTPKNSQKIENKCYW